jgi:hemolysin D
MPQPLARSLSLVCFAAFAGGCLLLLFGETDRVTTAPGVVRPVGETFPVQSSREGRVVQWRVPANEEVQAGELLGLLDTREHAIRRAATGATMDHAEASIDRLEALVEHFSAEACAADPSVCDEGSGLGADAQYRHEWTLESAERNAAAARAGALAAEQETITRRLRGAVRQMRWQQPECMAHRALAETGRVAEVQWWAMERRCAELEALKSSLEGELAVARAKVREHEADEHRRRAAVRRAWGDALVTALHERDALLAEAALLDQQIAQARIMAPASGRLDCSRPRFDGIWLRAGEPLCSVVPQQVTSEVQAALPEQAREGIHLGQSVSLRVLALPWLRHGLIGGSVSAISADTRIAEDTDGLPVYRVTIALDPHSALNSALTPGMRVEADFHRGREPLWRWLITPFAEIGLRAAREP